MEYFVDSLGVFYYKPAANCDIRLYEWHSSLTPTTQAIMGNNNLDETTTPGVSASQTNPAAFTLLPEPVVYGEVEGDVHKFEVSRESAPAGSAPAPAFENLGDLPASYHENVLF